MENTETGVAQLSKKAKSINNTLNSYRANLRALFSFEHGPFSSFLVSIFLIII